MLAIQNISVKPSSMPFKGNDNKACETHSALKTRGIASAINGIIAVTGISALKSDDFVNNSMKNFAKGSLALLAIGIAATLGCGALIDSMFNYNHKLLAQEMKTKSKQDILKNNDDIYITDKGNMYYHANTGKKVGTLYGAIAAPALTILSSFLYKTPIQKASIPLSIVLGTIAGLISGTVSDFFANRTAKKFADRQAIINGK